MKGGRAVTLATTSLARAPCGAGLPIDQLIEDSRAAAITLESSTADPPLAEPPVRDQLFDRLLGPRRTDVWHPPAERPSHRAVGPLADDGSAPGSHSRAYTGRSIDRSRSSHLIRRSTSSARSCLSSYPSGASARGCGQATLRQPAFPAGAGTAQPHCSLALLESAAEAGPHTPA